MGGTNVSDYVVSLDVISNIGDVAYIVTRLIALIAIFFGLIFYFGRLSKENYTLKKYSKFETDLKNYAVGLVITLAIIFISSVLFVTLFDITIPSDTSASLLLIIWMLIWMSIYLLILDQVNGIKSSIINVVSSVIWFFVCVGIPFFIIITYQDSLLVPIIISILLFGVAICGFVFYSGKTSPITKHDLVIHTIERGPPLQDLTLYQTTDVDYRFVKLDDEGKIIKEVVIPISQVKQIVYEKPEEIKTPEDQEAD